MNLRNIKRTEAGYTNLKKSEANVTSLCEVCGNDQCSLQNKLSKITNTYNLTAPVTQCQWYKFPLVFQKTKGLTAQRFNTLRVGKAWSERLQADDTVGLYDISANFIGFANVYDVELLPVDEALRHHGYLNHMVIEEALKPEEASEKMRTILRNAYGNLVMKNATALSVIYLEPHK